MAKPVIERMIQQGNATNTNAFPVVDRLTAATLPNPLTEKVGALCLITDGTFAPGAGQGSAPVGGGSLLNLVWNNGQAWITV